MITRLLQVVDKGFANIGQVICEGGQVTFNAPSRAADIFFTFSMLLNEIALSQLKNNIRRENNDQKNA